MDGSPIPRVIADRMMAHLVAEREIVAMLLGPDADALPVDVDTWVPTPEQFTVQADYLGEEYLCCPACVWQNMWEVRIGVDDGPANDLGSLMAAAREHVADKHSGEG